MPELPDVVIYLERLDALIKGATLDRLRISSPWILRSYDPPVSAVEGKRVLALRRIGKRIVLEMEGDLFIVVHLMIAGRLRWRERGVAVPKRRGLAAFDFPAGTVLFTEEGSTKRASLHLVRGAAGLGEHDRGGIEPLEATLDQFVAVLGRGRHTLKRALTDPRNFSGIGGAYADEIMHRARVSPIILTDKLTTDDVSRLHASTIEVLSEWIERLRTEVGEGFPEKVTAFHPDMAVHGKHGQPCPVCGSPVQRIVYANNETNYCARCQTGGRVLADRALSRLLKDQFPRELED